MEFCCYVGVVSPTTPVRTACVLPIYKTGSYFRLRSLLLSVCSFVLARTELSHRFGSACQIYLQAAFQFQISCAAT